MKKRPYLIGLCGGSGSGKSWLSVFLREALGHKAVIVCQDWYYHDNAGLSAEESNRLNFDHPNAIETPLFYRQMRRLLSGESIEAPSYHYATHSRLPQTRLVEPKPIVIVEGLFVLHDKKVRDLFDLTVYIDVPDDERLLRRIRRDVEHRRVDLEETLRLYEHCVRPMHRKYILPSAAHADMRWDQFKEPSFPRKMLATVRAELRGTRIRRTKQLKAGRRR